MADSEVQPEGRGRRIRGTLLIVAIAVLVAAAAWWFSSKRIPDPVYDVPRTVRYSIEVRNPDNVLRSGAAFWAFAPVAQTASQKVVEITSSAEYEIEADASGNQRLVFTADLPPYATKIVRIDVKLRMATSSNRLPEGELAPFLRAEPKIQSEASEIVALATNLKDERAADTADSIFRWVSSNVEYAGYVRDDRGALYALQEGRGDCTEYSYLFTALARAAGLPTRPMAGFVTGNDAVLRARDLHNWAEVYLDNRWRIVDPQNEMNRVDEHHFVAMRVLGKAGADLSSTHQLVGGDEGLEVTMR